MCFPGAAQHHKRVHARLARAMVVRCRPGIVSSELAKIPDQRCSTSYRTASGKNSARGPVAAMPVEAVVRPAMASADRGAPERLAPHGADYASGHSTHRARNNKASPGASCGADHVGVCGQRSRGDCGKCSRGQYEFTHRLPPIHDSGDAVLSMSVSVCRARGENVGHLGQVPVKLELFSKGFNKVYETTTWLRTGIRFSHPYRRNRGI
jgi:hypothetical protein